MLPSIIGEHPLARNADGKLKSTDNQWSCCTVPPEQYFNPDGSLKVKEKLDPAEIERLEALVRFSVAQLSVKRKRR